ncbi:MAG: DUF4199 domain-containing protein [Bacteroidota bacterium]
MKKTVIKFGLMAGLIASVWMLGSMALCYGSDKFEGSMLLGFSSMIIAFSVMYPAIKGYRDKHNNGIISFGEAFKMAITIAFIGSTMYVGSWLIDYYFFLPDFLEKYSAHIMAKAQSGGATEIAAKTKEVASMKKWYSSIFGVVFMTYMEIFPLGLIVAVIISLILKRKTNPDNAVIA